MARGQSERKAAAFARALPGAALAACLLTSAAVAGPPQTATAEVLDLAFKDWMRRHHVSRGVLAVSYANRLALVRGYGGTRPAAPPSPAGPSQGSTGALAA